MSTPLSRHWQRGRVGRARSAGGCASVGLALGFALLVLAAWRGAAAESVPPLEPAMLAAWGVEALAQIQQDPAQPGGALYAEHSTPDGKRAGDFGKYAFIWPSSYQLRALASACRAQPQVYQRTLNAFAEALDEYWITKDGLGGYAVLPKGSERYYDDNASMMPVARAYWAASLAGSPAP